MVLKKKVLLIPMSENGYIYTLNDPRTGEPKYVGATSRTPKKRLRQHTTTPTNQDTREWFEELDKDGLKPVMTVVRFTDVDELNEEEKQVYERLSTEYELLNKQKVDYKPRGGPSSAGGYQTPSVCRKGSEVDEFLTELQASNPAIESYSAAVRYCVRQQMQRENL